MPKRMNFNKNAYQDDLTGMTIEQFQQKYNTLEEYTQDFVDGFILNESSIKGFSSIDDSTLEEWFSNPEKNYKEIADIMTYMYISDGDIYQSYSMFTSLPKLDYKIKVFDQSKSNVDKNLITCDKLLYQIKYKLLTRDIISQLNARGFLVCMWLGDKKNPYLYVFEDNEHVFPQYRRNGDWVCCVDMAWIKDMKETEREIIFETLKGYISKSQLEAYEKDKTKQYVELPQERTSALRINTIYRNQRIGLPNGIQALFNISHRQKLKTLEDAIVNKIVKNVAVLTIGNDKKGYIDVNKSMKQKIVSSVRNTLEKANSSKKIPFCILPEYASLEFGEATGFDGLDSKKFDAINDNISMNLGINSGLMGSGASSNLAIAKLNKTMLYKRIGVMLEIIEDVYNKLFTLVLPKGVADNFYFEFVKGEDLSNKELIDILVKLNSQGYSLKEVCDALGVNFTNFVNQSLYEIEELKLREKIMPPQTSYTMSGDTEGAGRSAIEDPENENTISDKSAGKTESKKA